MEPYSTARDEFDGVPEICLDANENPNDNGYNRYPDPHQKALKQRISEIKGVNPDRIFVGNGSDEAIDLCFRVFCRPGWDNAVSIAPSYGMYKVAAHTNDVEFREVQLGEDFTLDEGALFSAVDARTKLLFICSPNNPTGNIFPLEQLGRVIRRFGGIVVLDEAYVDFSSGGSMLPELDKYPNLIILQTMSKARGMAALRVGMAFASPLIAGIFARVKYPYNLGALTQNIVLKRLETPCDAQVAQILSERARVRKALEANPLVQKIYPSEANFLLVKVIDAKKIYNILVSEGIIVRDRSNVKGCESCLRITIGTKRENDRLLYVLHQIAAEEKLTDKESKIASDDRSATVMRATTETQITVMLDLDGRGPSYISTGIGFFDHMLDQLVHHGGMSLLVDAKGDLKVDEHHTIEDVGIAIGEAMRQALGNKAGIARYGFVLPMDESEARVLVDFGGRIDFKWDVSFSREKIGEMPTEMFEHFFRSFADAARCNLHISATGENEHHKIEGVFKAFARAVRYAAARTVASDELPSSKGVL
ncbi:MAG: histidinol-phosphate transaminase [Clostridia bacterium]|nr:histidinol-phosphate transaminase [Clostridia bacterium]